MRCSGDIMEKAVEYFHYWYRYRESKSVPDMDIPVELCLELLVAADFLGLDGMAFSPSTLWRTRSCSVLLTCLETSL